MFATLLRVDVIAREKVWLVKLATLLLLFKACNKALFATGREELFFAKVFKTGFVEPLLTLLVGRKDGTPIKLDDDSVSPASSFLSDG